MSKTTAFLALAVLLAGLAGRQPLRGSVPIAAPDVVDALTAGPTEDGRLHRHRDAPAPGTDGPHGGAALAVAGLLMQTVFANPLADPSILGLTPGGTGRGRGHPGAGRQLRRGRPACRSRASP